MSPKHTGSVRPHPSIISLRSWKRRGGQRTGLTPQHLPAGPDLRAPWHRGPGLWPFNHPFKVSSLQSFSRGISQKGTLSVPRLQKPEKEGDRGEQRLIGPGTRTRDCVSPSCQGRWEQGGCPQLPSLISSFCPLLITLSQGPHAHLHREGQPLASQHLKMSPRPPLPPTAFLVSRTTSQPPRLSGPA